MVKGSRIGSLDGLRGSAALWVLLGHACQLSGAHIPIVSQPDLGVDLFIVLSGFLMAYQFTVRQEREPWSEAGSWLKFWTRRFFRIAPLYYILLIVSLLLGAILFADRNLIDAFNGSSPQLPVRYLDFSFQNVFMHITFLFGMFPAYAFRTPLPDWSIGLEMQFYAVFPFLMILASRRGYVVASFVAAFCGLAIVAAVKLSGISYPMPSFLPLKLNVFLAGMLNCFMGYARSNVQAATYAGLSVFMIALPGWDVSIKMSVARILIALVFIGLTHGSSYSSVVDSLFKFPKKIFSGKIAHVLGEISFSVYLIHLMVMQPVAAFVIEKYRHDISSYQRLLMVVLMTIIPTYILSYFAYKTIEVPGQSLGRKLINKYASSAK
jgi:peptidoglycan/LPS O-acetylase OafA/YrhL